MSPLEWIDSQPIQVVIDSVHYLLAKPKLFKTGSRGWHVSGKILLADEVVQVSLCLTVVGSKPGSERSGNGKENVQGPQGLQDRRQRQAMPQGDLDIIEVQGPLPPMPAPLKGKR